MIIKPDCSLTRPGRIIVDSPYLRSNGDIHIDVYISRYDHEFGSFMHIIARIADGDFYIIMSDLSRLLEGHISDRLVRKEDGCLYISTELYNEILYKIAVFIYN